MTQNRARHACMAGAVFRYVHNFLTKIGAAAQFARRRTVYDSLPKIKSTLRSKWAASLSMLSIVGRLLPFFHAKNAHYGGACMRWRYA